MAQPRITIDYDEYLDLLDIKKSFYKEAKRRNKRVFEKYFQEKENEE